MKSTGRSAHRFAPGFAPQRRHGVGRQAQAAFAGHPLEEGGGQQGDVISVPTYLDARAGVDALLDQLLELERQRKTVTISYLKSQLYEVQKNLMQNIPFSLRLGELEARKASQEPITAAELKSLENDLKALNIRLYQLQQGASGS